MKKHLYLLLYITFAVVLMGCDEGEFGSSNYTASTSYVGLSEYVINFEGTNTKVLEVSAGDQEWSVQVDASYTWLHVTPQSGKGSAKITVSVDDISKTQANRTGYFYVYIGSVRHTVDVYQTYVDVPDNYNTREFSVTNNGKTVTFQMIFVEAGTFMMGTSTGYDDEKPVHSVTLTKNYYLGQTEVTQELWQTVMSQAPTSDGSQWTSNRGLGNDYPAYYVSWDDCKAFITKLNTLTGQNFRLPTEAEWEYAARGGNKSQGYTYAGSNNADDVAWHEGNSANSTHPVAYLLPNELGLYDMSGNVQEWCEDWYHNTYYSVSPSVDPQGPDAPSATTLRVKRGGNWYISYENYCRVGHRSSGQQADRSSLVGLRLAL